jgi:anthranilate phosphoribosyltransferase
MMTGAVSEPAHGLVPDCARGARPDHRRDHRRAQAMRGAMTVVEAPANALDVCGTGGDGAGTLNVSTAAAFVVAGCGIPVAKHGNRAMSSRTGARDVLEELGVPVNQDAAAAKRHVESGFAFLFAPAYHPAMKHVATVRKELASAPCSTSWDRSATRAQVRRQLLGIFAEEWLEPVAHVLSDLGTEKAWIVHGTDGLDELTTTGRDARGRSRRRAMSRCRTSFPRMPAFRAAPSPH